MVVSQQFDPLEFLRVADSLVDGDSSEATLRTAVGRVYFAVFLVTREAFDIQGRSHIHGSVIGALRRYDRHASRQLERLMELRALADYDLQVQDPLRNDWQRNYQLARRLAQFVLGRLQ